MSVGGTTVALLSGKGRGIGGTCVCTGVWGRFWRDLYGTGEEGRLPPVVEEEEEGTAVVNEDPVATEEIEGVGDRGRGEADIAR